MLDAPPEITSTLIYTGPGATSLVQAALAWQQLGTELQVIQQQVTAVISGIPWSGPSAATMRARTAGYTAQLAALAATAATAGRAATAAATAYQQARTAVASPAHIAANRQLTVMLIGLNVLGQYSTAIALLESAYEQMWAQDIAAMHTYAAAAQAATSTLTTTTTTVTAPADSSDLTSWFDETFQSLLSSGPYEFPTSVLALVSGLWAASSVAAVPDVLNRVRNIVETPAPSVAVGPLPESRTAVSVRIGAGGRIGALTVPPNWAQPAERVGKIPVFIPPAATVRPAPTALPLPLPNISDRTREQHTSAQPRYGEQPTVMPKTPAGG